MASQKVIDNWKQSWRLHTVKFGIVLMALPELIVKLLDTLAGVLPAIPDVIKEYLPDNVRATLAIVGAISIALRLWRQENVDQYIKSNK